MTTYKFRPLEADEIDVRVGSVIQTANWQGVTLLLYKNARVDMDILDETVGAEYWQKRYKEIKGNLYCEIGIYNKELKEWIWKEDCGVESFSDKEKGEASDASKRSAVNWGIGRELYTAPNIMYACEIFVSQDGKKKSMKNKTEFYVSDIDYDEKRRISKLIIHAKTRNKDEIAFTYGVDKKPVQPSKQPTEQSVQTAPTAPKQQSFATTSKKTMSYDEACSFSVSSGKYANVPFEKVPTFYLEWIIKNFDEGKAKTAAQILLEHNEEIMPKAKSKAEDYLQELNEDDLGDIPF